MFEDHAFQKHFDNFLFLGGKPRDGFKLELEIAIWAALVGAEDQHICTSLTTCARADGCAVSNYPFLTAYERDNEIGLDYAKARYFSYLQGRFTNPDPLPASGKAAIPQSWNRYSYVLNNPLKFIDPSGMMWVYHYLG